MQIPVCVAGTIVEVAATVVVADPLSVLRSAAAGTFFGNGGELAEDVEFAMFNGRG